MRSIYIYWLVAICKKASKVEQNFILHLQAIFVAASNPMLLNRLTSGACRNTKTSLFLPEMMLHEDPLPSLRRHKCRWGTGAVIEDKRTHHVPVVMNKIYHFSYVCLCPSLFRSPWIDIYKLRHGETKAVELFLHLPPGTSCFVMLFFAKTRT